MKPILIDSSAYVLYMRGDSNARAVVIAAESLSMIAVVVGELLSGVLKSTRQKENRETFESFVKAGKVESIAVD